MGSLLFVYLVIYLGKLRAFQRLWYTFPICRFPTMLTLQSAQLEPNGDVVHYMAEKVEGRSGGENVGNELMVLDCSVIFIGYFFKLVRGLVPMISPIVKFLNRGEYVWNMDAVFCFSDCLSRFWGVDGRRMFGGA